MSDFAQLFFHRFHVPVAFYVMLSASNLLLVVNSSINFVIYCFVGKTFRSELRHVLGSMLYFVCCCCCCTWGRTSRQRQQQQQQQHLHGGGAGRRSPMSSRAGGRI